MARWQKQHEQRDADQLMLFTPGPVRAPDPVQGKRENSRAAADQVTPSKAASQRNRIHHFVHSRGQQGATRDEIVHTLGLDVQTVTPRVLELVRMGDLSEKPGETRLTRKGCKAAVLVATKPFVLSQTSHNTSS